MQDYGMDNISRNILRNSSYLIEKLKETGVDVITPRNHAGIVSCRFPGAERIWQQLLQQGISCAFRDGALRLSPHFYQGIELLDEFMSVFKSLLAK